MSTLELKRLIETANIKTQDYEIKYSLCKEKIDYINTKKNVWKVKTQMNLANWRKLCNMHDQELMPSVYKEICKV